MAITDTSPTESGAHAAAPPTPAARPATGLAAVVGSGDHKTIGRLYLGTALAFGVVSLAALAWFDLEASMEAGSQTQRAFLNFTLGQIGVIFGFIVPLFVGLATLVVPLQVGASTIAFPRAAAAALWTWVLSAVLFGVSYITGVGGGIGNGEDVNGLALTYLAIGGLVASLLLGTVCVMTTVVTLRPTGMGLERVPLFSWSMLVAGGLWLLTFPVLVANALLIFLDAKYGSATEFAVVDSQWAQLGWITSQPASFVLAIPVLGVVGDAIATLARARVASRGIVLGAIGAFGALTFGAYVQPAFNGGVYHQWPFVVQCVVIILPLLGFVAGLGMTLKGGKPSGAAPVLLGAVAILLLLLATLASAVFVAGPLDLQTTNAGLVQKAPALRWAGSGAPVYQWGVFAHVVVAALAGLVAGLFHWSPKITGRKLPDALGKLLALGLLAGGLLWGVPLLILGFANKASGIAESPGPMLLASLLGAVITLGVSALAFVLLIGHRARVLSGGATADADAWGCGQTLEWAADSPPAPGNFGELPAITSPEPLLDLADGGTR